MPKPTETMSPGAIEKASHISTNRRILQIVEPLLQQPLRILDVGCGSGYFLSLLAQMYEDRGWPADEYLLGIDVDLGSYRARGVPAKKIDVDEPLPFDKAKFDLVLAIEVFEHTRAPYLLMQDIARILVPGGRIVVSVPNVMHVLSRLSYLVTGHHYMYPTPSTRPENVGRLCGHVQPLPLQYWHYGLRRAGFAEIECHIDRIKKGAVFPAIMLMPLTMFGAARYARRIERYDAALAEEIRHVLPHMNSFRTLTARSLIFSARSENRPPDTTATTAARGGDPADPESSAAPAGT